jgi:hypothetical protein
MRVKFILPALTEATGPFFRPIKYSLFPPLGLATLAAWLDPDDEVVLEDEHVETLDLDDDPQLVVIQVYITSAFRAYRIADRYRRKGAYVVLGGLHVTSLPGEAARHADTIFLGPGEDTWPEFLADYRAGHPAAVYRSTVRTLDGSPPIRRDLIKRHLYLVPNSIVVSRGCPHACDFCYKEAFYRGGRGFYTQRVDAALAEIERLPGRHLYFQVSARDVAELKRDEGPQFSDADLPLFLEALHGPRRMEVIHDALTRRRFSAADTDRIMGGNLYWLHSQIIGWTTRNRVACRGEARRRSAT